MSDEPQGNGQDLAHTTATEPSGESQSGTPSAPSSDVETLKQQMEEYKSAAENYNKVKELYANYPNGAELFKKYVYDNQFRSRMDAELSGQAQDQTLPSNMANTEDQMESLDDDTRKAIDKIVEQRVAEKLKGTEQEVTHMKQQYYATQIEKWRSEFSKNNGYPVDFSNVESDIAQLINEGKAVDAPSAYKMIAFDHALRNKAVEEKELKKYKLQASMSRASLPTTLQVRNKGDKRNLASAWEEALEELGQS